MLEKRYVKWAVLLCSVTYFISYLTRINYGSVIIEIEKLENIGELASVALTFNAITYGVGQLISGYLGDKIKPTKLVFYGLVTTVMMNLILPFCRNITLMSVVWCINGLAQAFMWPPMVKYLTGLLTSEEYSKACVKVTWGSSIGTIAVYLLSPVCISLLDWRYVFFIAGGLGLIMAFVWLYASKAIEKKKISTKTVTAEKTKTESNKNVNINWNMGLIIMLGLTMLAIALQGILRDGITTWMPKYIEETYQLGSAISILTGVILPLFAIAALQIVSWIYIKWVKNEQKYAGIIFGIACAAALMLWRFCDKNAVLSVVLSAIITACMHGTNYILICMLPKYFGKYGKVSFMSGILNSCTYVGSSVAGYGMAVVSGAFGWNFTILLWSVTAGAGCIICLLLTKKWREFKNN